MSHTTANKGRLLLGLLFSQQGSAHKAVPERRCLSQGQTGMGRWSPGKLPQVGWDENSLRCLVCWSLMCQCFQRKMGGLIHLILTPWLTKNYSTPSYKLQADISQYSSYAFSSRDKSWLLNTSRKKLPLTISQDKHLSFQILNKPQKTFLTSRSFCSHIPTTHSHMGQPAQLRTYSSTCYNPAKAALNTPESTQVQYPVQENNSFMYLILL